MSNIGIINILPFLQTSRLRAIMPKIFQNITDSTMIKPLLTEWIRVWRYEWVQMLLHPVHNHRPPQIATLHPKATSKTREWAEDYRDWRPAHHPKANPLPNHHMPHSWTPQISCEKIPSDMHQYQPYSDLRSRPSLLFILWSYAEWFGPRAPFGHGPHPTGSPEGESKTTPDILRMEWFYRTGLSIGLRFES